FKYMASVAHKTKRWRDKLWIWVAHPAWIPADVERDPLEKKRMQTDKYRPAVTRELVWYLAGHFLLIGSLMVPYLLFEPQFTWPQRAVGAGMLVLSNVVFLGLVENKRWAHWLELARGPLTA